jgi:hypothetical protein
VVGSSTGAFTPQNGSGSSLTGAHTEVTVGGGVGGGVDFHLARWFSIGVSGGYNWVAPFNHPVGSRTTYSGADAAISFGFLFGKGR